MTSYGRREPRFSDITRIRKAGTRHIAMAGRYQKILVSTFAGGLSSVVGELDVGSVPRDVAISDTTNLFVLTGDGVTKTTLADTPVEVASVSFDVSDGEWIFYAGYEIAVVVPTKGGIRCYNPALTSYTEVRCGARSVVAADFSSEWVLYVVDEVSAKIHVFRVESSSPGTATFVGSFRAPNCRDVVRVVLDEAADRLFVICKRRILTFSVPNGGADNDEITVDKIADTGIQAADYTDFQVVTGGYWIGVDDDTAMNPFPQYIGRQVGVFDDTLSDNGALVVVAPDFSLFAASDTIPYVDGTLESGSGGIIAPNLPVITSSLTSATVEDTAWAYTITATGTGPISYSITNPPSWLTGINAITGAISGTPTDPSTVNITITATNASGVTSATLVLTVAAAIGNFAAVTVNGQIRDMVRIGGLVFMIGDFTSVTDASGVVARPRAACINLQTALWTAWNPSPNATAYSMSTDGVTIAIGGVFNVVAGVSRDKIARVDTTTGGVVGPAYAAPTVAVDCILYDGATVYIGGNFGLVGGVSRSNFAALNAATGALMAWNPTLPTTWGYFFPMSTKLIDLGGSILAAGGNVSTQSVGYGVVSKSTGAWAQLKAGASLTGGRPGLCVQGSTIYFAGLFTFAYSDLPSLASSVTRRKAAAFTLSQGAVTSWNPDLGAVVSDTVQGIVADSEGADVFLLGGFGSVGGNTANKHVARLTPSGSAAPGFQITWGAGAPSFACGVRYLSALVIGGQSTVTINGQTKNHFAVLNAATGALY